MHGVVHAAHQSVPGARLVRALEDGQSPTAVLEHLGHEGDTIQGSSVVERAEDLLCGAHLHKLAGSKTEDFGMVNQI